MGDETRRDSSSVNLSSLSVLTQATKRDLVTAERWPCLDVGKVRLRELKVDSAPQTRCLAFGWHVQQLLYIVVEYCKSEQSARLPAVERV